MHEMTLTFVALGPADIGFPPCFLLFQSVFFFVLAILTAYCTSQTQNQMIVLGGGIAYEG